MKLDPTTLALFLLATTGGAYVWAESVIGRTPRIAWAVGVPSPWCDLAYCVRCAAFWVALVLLVALLVGAPVWTLLPLAGVGLVRIVITPENALDGDAEWLRKRSGSDGRRDDAARASADGAEGGDEPAAPEAESEGAAEESAVRDEADAHGDGGAEGVAQWIANRWHELDVGHDLDQDCDAPGCNWRRCTCLACAESRVVGTVSPHCANHRPYTRTEGA